MHTDTIVSNEPWKQNENYLYIPDLGNENSNKIYQEIIEEGGKFIYITASHNPYFPAAGAGVGTQATVFGTLLKIRFCFVTDELVEKRYNAWLELLRKIVNVSENIYYTGVLVPCLNTDTDNILWGVLSKYSLPHADPDNNEIDWFRINRNNFSVITHRT